MSPPPPNESVANDARVISSKENQRRDHRIDRIGYGAIWPLIDELGLCFEGRNSGPSLASGIFSRSDLKTQTQYLTKGTPPDEFNFQLNVALFVDFLQGRDRAPAA
jgi:hypothetical protein